MITRAPCGKRLRGPDSTLVILLAIPLALVARWIPARRAEDHPVPALRQE
jgi:ABC-type lipoprotein release transport system permease subunit